MARTNTKFVCQNCGQEEIRWLGRCPVCQEWNSFSEVKMRSAAGRAKGAQGFNSGTSSAGGRRGAGFAAGRIPGVGGPDSGAEFASPVSLAEISSAEEPGATVIAVKDGEVVFKGGYGMANLELGVPLETDMVLRLGSMTKQFTAAAIMLLEQEGQLLQVG